MATAPSQRAADTDADIFAAARVRPAPSGSALAAQLDPEDVRVKRLGDLGSDLPAKSLRQFPRMRSADHRQGRMPALPPCREPHRAIERFPRARRQKDHQPPDFAALDTLELLDQQLV